MSRTDRWRLCLLAPLFLSTACTDPRGDGERNLTISVWSTMDKLGVLLVEVRPEIPRGAARRDANNKRLVPDLSKKAWADAIATDVIKAQFN